MKNEVFYFRVSADNTGLTPFIIKRASPAKIFLKILGERGSADIKRFNTFYHPNDYLK